MEKKGSYGRLIKSENDKLIIKETHDYITEPSTLKEIIICSGLKHSNLLRFTPDNIHVVKNNKKETKCHIAMEKYPIDLYEFKQKCTNVVTRINCLQEFIIPQLVNVINYIHCNGIVHHDIKTQNILIDEQKNKIALIDFGLANTVSNPNMSYGTKCFAPPEYKQHGTSTTSYDIWSFAIVIIDFILSSNTPENMIELHNRNFRKTFINNLEKMYSETAPSIIPITQILRACLRTEQNKRATAVQILSMLGYNTHLRQSSHLFPPIIFHNKHYTQEIKYIREQFFQLLYNLTHSEKYKKYHYKNIFLFGCHIIDCYLYKYCMRHEDTSPSELKQHSDEFIEAFFFISYSFYSTWETRILTVTSSKTTDIIREILHNLGYNLYVKTAIDMLVSDDNVSLSDIDGDLFLYLLTADKMVSYSQQTLYGEYKTLVSGIPLISEPGVFTEQFTLVKKSQDNSDNYNTDQEQRYMFSKLSMNSKMKAIYFYKHIYPKIIVITNTNTTMFHHKMQLLHTLLTENITFLDISLDYFKFAYSFYRNMLLFHTAKQVLPFPIVDVYHSYIINNGYNPFPSHTMVQTQLKILSHKDDFRWVCRSFIRLYQSKPELYSPTLFFKSLSQFFLVLCHEYSLKPQSNGGNNDPLFFDMFGMMYLTFKEQGVVIPADAISEYLHNDNEKQKILSRIERGEGDITSNVLLYQSFKQQKEIASAFISFIEELFEMNTPKQQTVQLTKQDIYITFIYALIETPDLSDPFIVLFDYLGSQYQYTT